MCHPVDFPVGAILHQDLGTALKVLLGSLEGLQGRGLAQSIVGVQAIFVVDVEGGFKLGGVDSCCRML